MSDLTRDSHYSRQVMIRRITASGLLTAMAVVLMYMEVSLPLMPAFLKFDFSEVPVLIGAFSIGPVYGVIVELLKNLVHLPATGTEGIGEMSNFITGSLYVFTAGLIYQKHRTRKGAVVAMLVGTAVLALISAPFNYFVTLPLYGSVLGFPMQAIIGMCNAANSHVHDKTDVILMVFVPFNLFKGLLVAFITFWVYKPISRLINQTYEKTH